ncbi:bifunctional hydroxymethylpyrimidine kinase/phosphomethylpyrimidine kinase, partial [Salmonella enterica]|uniref:bifunctional hydroxymethylpyrimidine kinase/phosphomethylpyrimidine kinase n=1 Tax=Salmonella enterica TaxID=28901 RepID=UPI00373FE01F
MAGTDPSGGGGIQAGLKTLFPPGAYGCSVIPAPVGPKNPGVQSGYPGEAGFVVAPPDFVFRGGGVVTTQNGVLGGTQNCEGV